MLTQLEIIGIGMHSNDPKEVLATVEDHMCTNNIDIFVGCLYALIHINRRFKKTDINLCNKIIEQSNQMEDDELLYDVLQMLKSDILDVHGIEI